MKMKESILIGVLIWNTIVFLIYIIDKWKARNKRWRIPEAVLITLAFTGGATGALFGMYLIRHKTKHLKFRILIPVFLVIQVILAFYLIFKDQL